MATQESNAVTNSDNPAPAKAHNLAKNKSGKKQTYVTKQVTSPTTPKEEPVMPETNETNQPSTETSAGSVEQPQLNSEAGNDQATGVENNASADQAEQQPQAGQEENADGAPAANDQPEQPSAAQEETAQPAAAAKAETFAAAAMIEEKPLAPEVVLTDFEQAINKLKADGTMSQKALVSSIEIYMAKLQPGKPTSALEGAAAQYSFWVVIRNLLTNAPAEEFRGLWSILLAYVNNFKDGIFHERYVFRFSEDWSNSQSELVTFQRILNLLKVTADIKGRATALKQIDLTRTMEFFTSEESRKRILSFYGK